MTSEDRNGEVTGRADTAKEHYAGELAKDRLTVASLDA